MTKLARQHIRFSHREGRVFARHERDTGRGVTDKRCPPPAPTIHPDLADPVEVDVVHVLQGCEDLRTLPTNICENVRQYRFAFEVAPHDSFLSGR